MILSRGTAGNCSQGVKVELHAGRSPIGSWRFSASSAEERVMVGSAADCDWRVIAPGVLEHHLELMWVSDTLWVSAASRQAEVWIDGAPVDAWTAIEWDTNVMFGGAELAVFGASSQEAQTVIASVEPLTSTRPPTAAPTARLPRVYQEEPTPVVRVPVMVEELRTIAPTETVIDPMPPAQPSARPPDSTAFTDLSSLQRWAEHAELCDEPTHVVVPAPAARPAVPIPAPVATPPIPTAPANPLTAPPPLLSPELAAAPVAQVAMPRARSVMVNERLAAPPPRVAPAPVVAPEPLIRRALEMLQQVREAIPSQVVIGGAVAIAIVVALLVLDRIGTKHEDAHAANAQMTVPTPTAAPIPQVVRNDLPPPIDPETFAREEAQAARLVAAGQLAAALPIYDRLAAASTDNQAYAIAAKVLRQQIAARCQNSPGGPGCPALP